MALNGKPVWLFFVLCLSIVLVASTNESSSGSVYAPLRDRVAALCAKGAPHKDDRVKILLNVMKTMKLHGKLGEKDIPGLYNDVDIPAYLDEVVSCNSPNTWLGAFLKKAYKLHDAKMLFDETQERDGLAEEVAFTVVYSAMVARLVRGIRRTPSLLKRLKSHIDQVSAQNPEWKKYFSTFGVAKKLTVDASIRPLVAAFDTGRIASVEGRRKIPLNILEASLEDYRSGRKDNAEAGLSLAFEAPGSQKYIEKTGEGPTTFSNDKRGIWYRFPLPKDWADLYQNWNMAFCTHYGDWGLFAAKLFNPAVSCYADEPNEYLYNRGVGLYIHIHYVAMYRLKNKSDKPLFDWSSEALSMLWGVHNKIAAVKYDKDLAHARGQKESKYSDMVRQAMRAMAKSTGETLAAFGQFIEEMECLVDIDSMSWASFFQLCAKAGTVILRMIKDIFWQ